MGAHVVDILAHNYVQPKPVETGVCGHCGDELLLDTDSVVVTIVRAYAGRPGERNSLYPLLNTDGEFAYSPWRFHRECWAEVYSNGQQEQDTAELGYVHHPPHVELYECSMCTSSIIDQEDALLAQVGVLEMSSRQPNGNPSVRLGRISELSTLVLCLNCTNTLDTEVLDMWSEGVWPNDEAPCLHGKKTHCWQAGSCHGCSRNQE